MPNILSKQYRGYFHVIAVVLAFVATILTSQEVADLGLPWVAPVAQGITALLLFLQQFTPIGDAPK